MATPAADPLTLAELDALDALNRARTPGPVAMTIDNRGRAHLYGGEDGAEWIDLAEPDEVRAVAAALNALPALLAEVRASRAAAVRREAMQPCCDNYRETT